MRLDGKITREEGILLVKKYDSEFPRLYFKETLEYLNINEELYWEVIDSWRSPHIWLHDGSEWGLRHAIWHEEHKESGRAYG